MGLTYEIPNQLDIVQLSLVFMIKLSLMETFKHEINFTVTQNKLLTNTNKKDMEKYICTAKDTQKQKKFGYSIVFILKMYKKKQGTKKYL